jgi:hypothetical protein
MACVRLELRNDFLFIRRVIYYMERGFVRTAVAIRVLVEHTILYPNSISMEKATARPQLVLYVLRRPDVP